MSATDIYAYVVSKVPLKLTRKSIDQYDIFIRNREGNKSVSTTPPGPGAEMYAVEVSMDEWQGVLHYKTHVKWHKIVPWLVRNIEAWQIWHRSRLVALAAP